MVRGVLKAVIVGLGAWLLSACASIQTVEGTRDPLEKFNRASYRFNDALDRHLLAPVAETYIKVVPQIARTGVSNFFDNLGYLNVVLNDFLQGKLTQGVSDSARFVVNSTMGLGGLRDIAVTMGLEAHDEDLGQTLGVWGFGEGYYLVLPLLGPTTGRDMPDYVAAAVTNPLFYVDEIAVTIPLGALGVVDTRARLDQAVKLREQAAFDPYVFTREAYLQRRTYLIYDGSPPQPDYEQLFEEDDEQDR